MPPSIPPPPPENDRQGPDQAQSHQQVTISRVHLKEPPQTPNSKGPTPALTGRSSGRASGPKASMAMEANSRPSDHLDRFSHDLSYSQGHGATNSLVENMLTSLDQFSGDPRNTGASVDMNTPMTADERRLYTSFRDDPSQSFSSSLRFNLFKQGRRRGHTHSSSRSSDYEPTTISRDTTQSSHGRRNPSSSTRQSSLGHIESSNGRGRIESQRAVPPVEQMGPPRTRGSKGSKGSTFSSTDFTADYRTGARPWVDMEQRRPTSLDHTYYQRGIHSSPTHPTLDPLNVEIPNAPAPHGDYDAAPTPTVHGGSSRSHTPPSTSQYPPQPHHPPPDMPPVQRKQSSKSSKSQGKKGKFTRITTARREEDVFNRISHGGDVPTMPPYATPSAPSPTIPYGKPIPYVPAEPAHTGRERPGFFRRMFSSSKQNADELHQGPFAPGEPESWLAQARAQSASNPSGASSTVNNFPPPLQPPPEPSQPAAISLNKKPSGFFRRRKKSVSDPSNMPPFPAPFKLVPRDIPAPVKTSPVSSLRKVMNPYLEKTETSAEAFFDTREHFHTSEESDAAISSNHSLGYFTDANATNLAVHRGSKQDSLSRSSSREPVAEGNAAPSGATTSQAKSSMHDNTMAMESPKSIKNVYKDSSSRPKSSVFPEASETCSRPEAMPSRPPPPEPKSPLPSSVASPTSPRSGTSRLHSQKGDLSIAIVKQDSASSGGVSRSPEYQSSPLSSPRSQIYLDANSSSPNNEKFTEAQQQASGLDVSREAAMGRQSENSDYKSVSSIPVLQVDDVAVTDTAQSLSEETLDIPTISKDVIVADIDGNLPTDEDRRQAQLIFDGDEEVIRKARAAAWLGESTLSSSRARRAYMDLFEWSNLNILASLRILCERLILKGESQQVDRILDAFTDRWCTCNPNHGFKTRGKYGPAFRSDFDLTARQMSFTLFATRFFCSTRIYTWQTLIRR
jgi:hypothetical protein